VTCNPNTIACQIELIRHSLDNPNAFQIWGFVVAVVAAIGSVAVAIVAARIAWQSNKTAESANKLTAEAQAIVKDAQDRERTRLDAVAADAARRERYEFAELLHAYLLDAVRAWTGSKVKPPLVEQWVAIAKRAQSLASANDSAVWIARSTARVGDGIKASPKSMVTSLQQIEAVTKMSTPQMMRITEWVTDPTQWLETHGATLKEEITAERAKNGHADDEPPTPS